MAKKVIIDGNVLVIPGVYNVPSSVLFHIAKRETMKYNGVGDNDIDIAMGTRAPVSILDLNTAVRTLRELLYQIRIEAQARKVQLGLSTNYVDGQFRLAPESCERPMLELMVEGLRKCVNDLLQDYDSQIVENWVTQ